MKNRKLITLFSVVAVLAVTIIACKDNFNEQDFLKLQNNLKTQSDSTKLNQQVKELNDAGKLLSFTVQIVDDRTPVQGAVVQISNDVSQSTGTSNVTTDANGNAIFPNVRVGNNTIIISKSGYITTTAVVDFGSLSNYYQVVSGANNTQNIVPLKQTKSVILPVFATGGTGNTATITGKVTIENDFTNTTPEIPQNLTIVANFASGLNGPVTGNGVQVLSYSFNSAGVGSAKVDNTTGLYSMVVPASAAGLTMNLLIPTIDGNIKMGANTIDSSPANGKAAPQLYPSAIINQAAQWGPLVVSYDNTIPSVAGVNAIFSTPTPSGSGLGFKFTALPRVIATDVTGHAPIFWDTYSNNVNVANPSSFDLGNSAYQLTSRGTGYTSSPSISVPGVSDAVVHASLRGILNSIAVSGGGTGYTAGNVTVTIQFKDSNSASYNVTSFACPVTVSGGAITAFNLPAQGTGLDVPFQTVSVSAAGYDVASLQVSVSGNTGTGVAVTPSFTMEVDHIQLANAGSVKFTSAPSFVFTGGGGTSQASLVCKEFRTQWAVAVDNSTVTQPYNVLPGSITFEYSTLFGGTNANQSVYDVYNNVTSIGNDLRASGGQVIQMDALASYRTAIFSANSPVALVTPVIVSPATGSLAVSNTDGSITGLTFTNIGAGYSSLPTVAVTPLAGMPGSGALIDISANTTFNPNTGVYTWSGASKITSPGVGYAAEVNKQRSAGSVIFSGPPANFTVTTGQTLVQNIVYGTGKRKNVVQ